MIKKTFINQHEWEMQYELSRKVAGNPTSYPCVFVGYFNELHDIMEYEFIYLNDFDHNV